MFVISSSCPFGFHPPNASCASQQQRLQLQQHVVVVLMIFPKTVFSSAIITVAYLWFALSLKTAQQCGVMKPGGEGTWMFVKT